MNIKDLEAALAEVRKGNAVEATQRVAGTLGAPVVETLDSAIANALAAVDGCTLQVDPRTGEVGMVALVDIGRRFLAELNARGWRLRGGYHCKAAIMPDHHVEFVWTAPEDFYGGLRVVAEEALERAHNPAAGTIGSAVVENKTQFALYFHRPHGAEVVAVRDTADEIQAERVRWSEVHPEATFSVGRVRVVPIDFKPTSDWESAGSGDVVADLKRAAAKVKESKW
jgi:hypothetical protein